MKTSNNSKILYFFPWFLSTLPTTPLQQLHTYSRWEKPAAWKQLEELGLKVPQSPSPRILSLFDLSGSPLETPSCRVCLLLTWRRAHAIQSLTPFFHTWLLTAFQPHLSTSSSSAPYLCKLIRKPMYSLFWQWGEFNPCKPLSTCGHPHTGSIPLQHKNPKPIYLYFLIKPFSDQLERSALLSS